MPEYAVHDKATFAHLGWLRTRVECRVGRPIKVLERSTFSVADYRRHMDGCERTLNKPRLAARGAREGSRDERRANSLI